MRQHGHSHHHGGDEGPGEPEQQLHRQQEERQTEAQPHAAGKYRRVPHRHAEGELDFALYSVQTMFMFPGFPSACFYVQFGDLPPKRVKDHLNNLLYLDD